MVDEPNTSQRTAPKCVMHEVSVVLRAVLYTLGSWDMAIIQLREPATGTCVGPLLIEANV